MPSCASEACVEEHAPLKLATGLEYDGERASQWDNDDGAFFMRCWMGESGMMRITYGAALGSADILAVGIQLSIGVGEIYVLVGLIEV